MQGSQQPRKRNRFSDGPPPDSSAAQSTYSAAGSSTYSAVGSSSGSWMDVEGGLGGLPSCFGCGEKSVSSAVTAHEQLWAAGQPTETIDQSFDASSSTQASMDEHIPEYNRGYKLLAKMGWRRGEGCGRRAGGRVEPVRITEQYATLGLGKATEYFETATAATETRRAMMSEVIASEDADAKAAREAKELQKQGIAEAVCKQVESFYCEVCDKQYTKVTEYENHLSSYDHHHKKRFKEMQMEQRARKAAAQASGPKKKEKKDPALVAAEAAAAAAAAAAAVATSSGIIGGAESSVATGGDGALPPPAAEEGASGPGGASLQPPPKFGGLSCGAVGGAGRGVGMKLGGGMKMGGGMKLGGAKGKLTSAPNAKASSGLFSCADDEED